MIRLEGQDNRRVFCIDDYTCLVLIAANLRRVATIPDKKCGGADNPAAFILIGDRPDARIDSP